MSEHITCNRLRKEELVDIRQKHSFNSLDQVLVKLIELYKREYQSPKDILIDELNIIQNKYHYIFTDVEAELYCLFIALIRGSQKGRVGVAETILRRVNEDYIKSLDAPKTEENGNESANPSESK